jgi:hypothetical protein
MSCAGEKNVSHRLSVAIWERGEKEMKKNEWRRNQETRALYDVKAASAGMG